MEIDYLAAFLLGLFGGIHCVGMCGGIVTLLATGGAPQELGRSAPVLQRALGYNLGRLFSYVTAGGVLGGISSLAVNLTEVHVVQVWLHALVGLLMLVMGLYLGGWWPAVARIEGIGAPIWRRLQPLAQRLLPAATIKEAVAVGVVWGWVPCGMVYTVLIWVIATGSATQGMLLMACFGLGTLPNLMLMGVAAARLTQFVRHPNVRRAAGLLVMAFGLVALLRIFR